MYVSACMRVYIRLRKFQTQTRNPPLLVGLGTYQIYRKHSYKATGRCGWLESLPFAGFFVVRLETSRSARVLAFSLLIVAEAI
jgi:hypothetical protein